MEAMAALVVGPAGSGKTTLLRSYSNDHREVFPTAGFEVVWLQTNQRTVMAYDSSGAGVTRGNWDMLCELCECVIYVIDCTDDEHFSHARRHLLAFLERNKSMRSKALCICLNKSDVKPRQPKEVYEKALEADRLLKLVARIYIKETSAYNKEGIEECVNWIVK